MKRFSKLLLPLSLSLCVATIANAQATRTWVSGVGDDANPCSRTAPCKTWAGAISKTAPGGEIDALDPGGFGALTITKAITIEGTGNFASTLVAGTNGFVVAAGLNDVVTIRRVSFQGLLAGGNGGTNGIRFISGKSLSVDNCIIQNFNGKGIDFEPSNSSPETTELLVRDTFIMETTNEGILVQPGNGTVIGNLNRVRQSHSITTTGLNVVANAKVAVADSDFSQNPVGAGVAAQQGTAEVDAAGTMFTNNAFGVLSGVAGGAATVRLTRCTITGNTNQGVLNTAPATTVGFQTNLIAGNANGNAPSSSVASQ